MDRLDGARLVALAGLGLSLTAVALTFYLYGPFWLSTRVRVRTLVEVILLFVPGVALTSLGWWFYQRLPVALRSRSRAPFLALVTSIVLPLLLLAWAVVGRLTLLVV